MNPAEISKVFKEKFIVRPAFGRLKDWLLLHQPA